MNRFALIKDDNKKVENVIVLEDMEDWQIPDGFYLVKSEKADIGQTHTGGFKFSTEADPNDAN